LNTDLIIPLLIYCGIAFAIASVAVLVQVALLDITARNGRWIIPMVPPAIVLGVLMTSAFAGRNLKLMSNDGSGAEADVAWVSRSMSLTLLAFAIAKIFTKLREFRHRTPVANPDQLHRALYASFAAFFLGMYVFPMAFSANPTFTYKGFFAFVVFTAAYVCRKEPLAPVITTTKIALLVIMIGSLAAAVIKPELAVESNYTGSIPGLHSRLWGLAAHANGLGALALLLILLLILQPSPRKLVGAAMWVFALVVLLLSQSKTTWLAGLLIWVVLAGYRQGRDERGRLKIGFVLSLLVPVIVVAVAALFVDVGRLMGRFEDSGVGASVSSLTGRTEVWAAALQMWRDSPVFGYGLDAWAIRHRLQLGLPFAVHAHNQLMQALSVGGSVAAVTLLAYFTILAKAAWRTAKKTGGVSLGLFIFIAMRCISEVPLDISGILSGEVLCQLLLFMLVVSESPESVVSARQDATQPRQWGRSNALPQSTRAQQTPVGTAS